MTITAAQLAEIRALINGAQSTPIPRGANDVPTAVPWPPRDKAQLDTLDLLEGLQTDLVCLASAAQWEDDAQPPAGTRATPYLPVLPSDFTRAQLKSMTYWNAFAPAAGETLTLRIYKYFADGSGLVLMTDPLVIDDTFADFTTVDVSANIRANRFWEPGDILALSRVYAGPNRLQAPLIAWDFELVPETSVAAVVAPDPVVWPAP